MDSENNLNALLRRREQLISLAERRRNMLRLSSSRPHVINTEILTDEKIEDLENDNQTESTSRNNSCDIENSNNDIINTSTVSLPLTHDYFNSPKKEPCIISNILIPQVKTPQPHHSAHQDPNHLPPQWLLTETAKKDVDISLKTGKKSGTHSRYGSYLPGDSASTIYISINRNEPSENQENYAQLPPPDTQLTAPPEISREDFLKDTYQFKTKTATSETINKLAMMPTPVIYDGTPKYDYTSQNNEKLTRPIFDEDISKMHDLSTPTPAIPEYDVTPERDLELPTPAIGDGTPGYDHTSELMKTAFNRDVAEIHNLPARAPTSEIPEYDDTPERDLKLPTPAIGDGTPGYDQTSEIMKPAFNGDVSEIHNLPVRAPTPAIDDHIFEYDVAPERNVKLPTPTIDDSTTGYDHTSEKKVKPMTPIFDEDISEMHHLLSEAPTPATSDRYVNIITPVFDEGTPETHLPASAPISLIDNNADKSHYLNPKPTTSSTNNDVSNIQQNIADSPKARKRHRAVKRPFIDYTTSSDYDFSSGSSDLWSNDEGDVSSDNMKIIKKKNKKKTNKNNSKESNEQSLIQKKEKRINRKKMRTKLKNEGKSYETKNGNVMKEKKIKENPCTEGKCVKKCFEISEERRISLFNHFWSLDTQRRRDWIVRCTRTISVKRKRISTPTSRRNVTNEYLINEGESYRQVCQKFLLATLDITQKYLLYTIQNSIEDMASTEKRKRNASRKYTEEGLNYIRTFIEKLPVMPSHYSRKRSKKMYLPESFKNIAHIYRIYCDDCAKNKKEIVSEYIFRQIFNEYNLSVHVPKKDKCVICTRVENNKQNNITNSAKDEEDLKSHLEEKKASYKRFQFHQNLKSLNNDTITTSFDLQKVLGTPYGDSMLLYYSRKYSVFDFTLYESTTQDAFCFIWGEADGKRGSNEIATCLLKYLENVDKRGIRNLLLYCDSCSGQNRNRTVLALFNHFLKSAVNLEVIQINYLLPGHTYMPVDSVHAIIEREVKRVTVWGPSQWATFITSSRKNPRPYNVEVLDHTDFLNLEDLTAKTFSPMTTKKIKIQSLRIATFKKKMPDQVTVKYSMKEGAEEVKLQLFEKTGKETSKGKGKGKGKGKAQGKGKRNSVGEVNAKEQSLIKEVQPEHYSIKSLYNARLPISTAKYNDLKRLCNNGTIPRTYHSEYLQLPTTDNKPDILPETDEEDVEVEVEEEASQD